MADMIERLVSAFKLMAERNDVLQDTHGNLSVRIGDEIYIKPSGVPFNQIGPKEICRIQIMWKTASWLTLSENGLRASVDLPHHIQIYRSYPDVTSICHTHSPNVVAHAIIGDDITCCTTEQADYFGSDIKCFPYSDLDSWGRELSVDKYWRPITTLAGRKAAILQHHGALTLSNDPIKAVNLAIALENVARKNVLAGMLTVPLLEKWRYRLPNEEIAKWHRRYQDVYGQK